MDIITYDIRRSIATSAVILRSDLMYEARFGELYCCNVVDILMGLTKIKLTWTEVLLSKYARDLKLN